MTRQEANHKLLEFISREVEDHSDLRFGQILCNIGISKIETIYDEWAGIESGHSNYELNCINYYEESEVTLKRVLGE